MNGCNGVPRRLDREAFPPEFQCVAKIPQPDAFGAVAVADSVSKRRIEGDEINFPLDGLTYIGHVSVSAGERAICAPVPPSACRLILRGIRHPVISLM
jgi:hypothetical protein